MADAALAKQTLRSNSLSWQAREEWWWEDGLNGEVNYEENEVFARFIPSAFRYT